MPIISDCYVHIAVYLLLQQNPVRTRIVTPRYRSTRFAHGPRFFQVKFDLITKSVFFSLVTAGLR